jgi:tripartite-type tricarboxylate transporter receptor subunit TctC
MSAERLPAFQEIPTLKEQGVDWQVGGWVGLGAPANLPQ